MPTSLRGARILAADLSLSCSGICVLDLDSMLPIEGKVFICAASTISTYGRAYSVAKAITDVVVIERYVAFEGPATNSRFRNEETTAIRQAFFDRVEIEEDRLVIVPPTSAKLALTGKGNADKMTMVNAALAQTRGTPFFDTLSALVKKGRKHNPEAEAIADAFGVARAAAKILFQRNARQA